jgi:hypothetical protein
MKTLNLCIRCHSLRDGEKRFNNHQITSIWLLREAGLEFNIVKDVCCQCRKEIGDEVSDKMLGGYHEKW